MQLERTAVSLSRRPRRNVEVAAFADEEKLAERGRDALDRGEEVVEKQHVGVHEAPQWPSRDSRRRARTRCRGAVCLDSFRASPPTCSAPASSSGFARLPPRLRRVRPARCRGAQASSRSRFAGCRPTRPRNGFGTVKIVSTRVRVPPPSAASSDALGCLPYMGWWFESPREMTTSPARAPARSAGAWRRRCRGRPRGRPPCALPHDRAQRRALHPLPPRRVSPPPVPLALARRRRCRVARPRHCLECRSWRARSTGGARRRPSVDGTTDYLDQVATAEPARTSVYRKPIGAFWDGKQEMVSAPLRAHPRGVPSLADRRGRALDGRSRSPRCAGVSSATRSAPQRTTGAITCLRPGQSSRRATTTRRIPSSSGCVRGGTDRATGGRRTSRRSLSVTRTTTWSTSASGIRSSTTRRRTPEPCSSTSRTRRKHRPGSRRATTATAARSRAGGRFERRFEPPMVRYGSATTCHGWRTTRSSTAPRDGAYRCSRASVTTAPGLSRARPPNRAQPRRRLRAARSSLTESSSSTSSTRELRASGVPFSANG